jgi:hypothetical protein
MWDTSGFDMIVELLELLKKGGGHGGVKGRVI